MISQAFPPFNVGFSLRSNDQLGLSFVGND